MKKVLFTAPYMIPFVERFRPIFTKYGVELIEPKVEERMEEADILKYAGQFDGTICGDDRYTPRVLEACSPRLKIISPARTGSMFPQAKDHFQVGNRHRFDRRRYLRTSWHSRWPHAKCFYHTRF